MPTRHNVDIVSEAYSAGFAVAPDPTPIVFIVDDDISVRESLEMLVGFEGWHRPRP